MPDIKHINFLVSSMVGLMSQEPIVRLTIDDNTSSPARTTDIQMPPEEARKIGIWMLECAEAAQQEHQVVTMLTDQGASLNDAAVFIRRMREEREERRAKRGDAADQ